MMTRVEGLAVYPDMISGPQVGGPDLHLLVAIWIYIIAFAPHPTDDSEGAPHPTQSGRGEACPAGTSGSRVPVPYKAVHARSGR